MAIVTWRAEASEKPSNRKRIATTVLSMTSPSPNRLQLEVKYDLKSLASRVLPGLREGSKASFDLPPGCYLAYLSEEFHLDRWRILS